MERLFKTAGEALVQVMSLLEDPNFTGVEQESSLVTHCKKIQKEDGKITWSESAEIIFRKFKAYTPWPGVYALFEGQRICFEHLSLLSDEQTRQLPSLPENAGDFLIFPKNKYMGHQSLKRLPRLLPTQTTRLQVHRCGFIL